MWTGPKLQVQEEAQCKEGDDSESKVPSWAPSQKHATVSPGQRAGLGPHASSLGLKHFEPQVCSRNYLEDLTGPPARVTIPSDYP